MRSLTGAPPPIDVEAATDFTVTQELLDMQRQMAELFLRQQRRGGIIDLEAEGVKLLLTTEDNSNDSAEQPSPPGTSLNAIAPQPAQVVRKYILCNVLLEGTFKKFFIINKPLKNIRYKEFFCTAAIEATKSTAAAQPIP